MASPIFQMRLHPEQRARWQAAANQSGHASLAEFVKMMVDAGIASGVAGLVPGPADKGLFEDVVEVRQTPPLVLPSGGKIFRGPDPKGGRK